MPNQQNKSVSLKGMRLLVDEIGRERNLPVTAVEAALREALLKGYERYRRSNQIGGTPFEEDYFTNFEVYLDLDRDTFQVVAMKEIVREVENPDRQISVDDLTDYLLQENEAETGIAPDDADWEEVQDRKIGQTVWQDVTPEHSEFGRMAAIQAKQVLAQKLRDRQRQLIQEEFEHLENTVLIGRVTRFERQSIVMAVSSGFNQPEVEAELPVREQLPNDSYRIGRSYKVFLKKVRDGSQRGPQLIVSRAAAGLVVELFINEVPEIEEEIVRIIAVAREANPPTRNVGPRTKIAVDTLEGDVDPVGACIGARGSRIKVVVDELQGEKIDAIRWSPDPGIYIANSLSPARIDEVRLVNPEDRQAHVLVSQDQLSLAIGKEGQNVRLAARLTGWKIDIKDRAKYDPVAAMVEVEEQRKIFAAARAEAEAIEAAKASAEAVLAEDTEVEEEEKIETEE
jgi:N utilization substance protein A